jgi:hypothetical protein
MFLGAILLILAVGVGVGGCKKKTSAPSTEALSGSNSGSENECPAHEPRMGSGNGLACEQCSAANCQLTREGDAGCCQLSDPNDQRLCIAATRCFRNPPAGSPNPCTSSGDPTACFCGRGGGINCFSVPGAADGPCVKEVRAAAKSTDPAVIHDLFTEPKSPLGRAVNLMLCRGASCQIPCEIH